MASITFDGPDGTEQLRDLATEDVWYQLDTNHWVVRVGSTPRGDDVLRHIPDRRVYVVEKEQPVTTY